MDFYKIKERPGKKDVIEIYPDFQVGKSKDLMIRGKSFYAVWNQDIGLWSTDESDVTRLVDNDLYSYAEKARKERPDFRYKIMFMKDFSSNSWRNYRNYISNMYDNAKSLDDKLTFANSEVKKNDHVSKKLEYPLLEGKYDAFNEMMNTLYSPEEKAKLEWAIGSIVSGDSKTIQKFVVLYGEPGAGKSTVLNIIQELFDGYYTTFEAKELASSNNTFSTEIFKSNPLVAIQHDGDLSKIEDNTKFNSIISHEEMVMHEKYKSAYMARANSFLFIATNKPVKITDGKSGLIRRLIDVHPTGKRLAPKRYQILMEQIKFELGAIAYHCLQVYREMGKNYYSDYTPVDMMMKTDVFYNFVESEYEAFRKDNGVTLKSAYARYKQYCDETLVDFKLPMYKFREELKNYFSKFENITRINGAQVRSYYSGFMSWKFIDAEDPNNPHGDEKPNSLILDKTESLFDVEAADWPAQYAKEAGTPNTTWAKVKTQLRDLDTTRLHYVKVPENHIVIDFDIPDDNGYKSYDRNLEAASKWPATYAELSKSGCGIHLHYIYDGDVSKLSRVYDDHVEVKVFTGNSSLRRQLTRCNDIPIRTISSGLPLKGEKKPMINQESVKSEKKLRELIERALNKDIHPNTAPNVSFIKKILDDAYENKELHYDVTNMRPRILSFALGSTNQKDNCIKMVNEMKFKSEESSEAVNNYDNDDLIFFDVEVFPNLFVVVLKHKDKDSYIKLINPTSEELEPWLKFKLVGFNCRRYDNHIVYARWAYGYSNEQLYDLSQKIINGSKNAMFGEAYNLSYTDIYDFSSKKQSLKKFEIELKIHHQELGLRWDQPVPEEMWETVAGYCCNDVMATEATFNARQQDFIAREILADISGLTVNDTNNQHTAKIIFGDDKNPQSQFVYTDLSQMFPGYSFDHGHSLYRGEDPGEGGYVYAEPGMYENVALLDVASMHPSSLIALNLFGDKYTANFKQLLDIRLHIKHKEYAEVKKMYDGKLAKYLTSDEQAKSLSNALKIVINSVYGLTSAKFDNKFKDPRNIDNIVAKRGALFMIDLKHLVQEKGFTVAHIKTDSIKIPNATPEIIQFVMDIGEKYGYTFEHEATYEKMCLVNDAVYIAKVREGEHANEWTATGAQFQHPYVFKTLFSKEQIDFDDMCETKSVTSALYLDMNENLPDVTNLEKEYEKLFKKISDPKEVNNSLDIETERLKELETEIGKGHNYRFVGKVGQFVPVKPGSGGGFLLREKDGKYYSATGAKGYRWLEAETVRELKKEQDIDINYYRALVDDAVANISQYGDFEWFRSDEPVLPEKPIVPKPLYEVLDIESDELPF